MSFCIFVKTLDGKTICLSEMTPITTIGEILLKIEYRTGIKPENQVLVYGSKPIVTDRKVDGALQRTIADYNIQKDGTLMLAGRLLGGANLELKIRLTNDEEIKLDINNLCTVRKLKEEIYKIKKCLDVSSMTLECASVPLDSDEKTLKHYNLKSGVTIIQSKCSLAKIPGLIISYNDDVLGMSDDGEACAKMPCGHGICVGTMT